MITLKIDIGTFSISSTWQCMSSGGKYRFINNTPTWGTHYETVRYSIPSGAVIKTAKMYVSFSMPFTGYSVITVDGSELKQVRSGIYAADIYMPKSSGGNRTFGFTFKANGNLLGATGISMITFRDVYFEIVYEIPEPAPMDDIETVTSLKIPPQSCGIYDPDKKKTYLFDGVIRIQHQQTMKLEEEPDEKKLDSYVNNAKNEPDKLTLDVMMSDVYDGKGALAGSSKLSTTQSKAKKAMQNSLEMSASRSATAYAILRSLKQSRRKLYVITPQYIYVNMVIASIVANQDETCPYGWTGQIGFQQAYKAKAAAKATGNNNSKPKTGTALPPDKSGFAGAYEVINQGVQKTK